MNWDKLLLSLHEHSPHYNAKSLGKQEIFGYELITPGLSYQDGILYIGWTSQLNALENAGFRRDAPILCIEDVRVSGERFPNLALLDELSDLDGIVQHIVSILAGESRTHAGIHTLLSAYNANRGLQYIADVASELLGNPLCIAEVSYKILAMSAMKFDGNPDIEKQRELGYVLPEFVSDLRKDAVHENARKRGRPYRSFKADGTVWVTTNVYLNSVEVAHIDVLEQNRSFKEGDFLLLQFASELVSLELQKNDFFKANRGFMHSYFLAELIDGQIPDASVVHMRLSHLNWTPAENLYVMIVADTKPTPIESKSTIISQQLHDILPGSRWTTLGGSLVFLLDFKENDTSFFESGSELDKYLEINSLVAAISCRFTDLLLTHNNYQSARDALSLGRRLEPSRRIHFYPNYVANRLGEIISGTHELSSFLHPAIPEIIRYDKDHRTNLLETLSVHLQFGDNPTLVAARLFIHRNTLFYRLSKIRELFNLDLSSGNERMWLLLSLGFLQIIGS